MSSKNELIKEAQQIADEMSKKKTLIQSALDDLDKKAEDSGVTQEHILGMSLIEKLFIEFDELKSKQDVIFEKIKK